MDYKYKVMFFGHSFVHRLQKHFYSAKLFNMDLDSHCKVVFLAKPGGHLADMRRLSNVVFESKPDILIMDIGSNDLCLDHKTLANFMLEYKALIQHFCVNGIRKIVLLPIWLRSHISQRHSNRSLGQYNELVKQVNKALLETFGHDPCQHIFFYRIRGIWQNHANLQQDGVHPNDVALNKFSKAYKGCVLLAIKHV